MIFNSDFDPGSVSASKNKLTIYINRPKDLLLSSIRSTEAAGFVGELERPSLILSKVKLPTLQLNQIILNSK